MGWTNEAQIPLYQDYASALTAYNEIDPADAALKEAAYGAVMSAFDALAAPLNHTQDILWDLPAATASRHGHRGQELGAERTDRTKSIARWMTDFCSRTEEQSRFLALTRFLRTAQA